MDIQTSHQLLDKIAEVKSANGSIAATVLTPQQIAGIEGDAKREAIKNILQVGVIGAGGAVGFRSAQGLWNLLTRAGKPSMSRAGVSPLPVPYPVEEEEEEELRKVAQSAYIDPTFPGNPLFRNAVRAADERSRDEARALGPPTSAEDHRQLAAQYARDQEYRDLVEAGESEMALDEPDWSSENILGTGISARQLGYGALGGAALGAGGYGLYRYLNRDKDEEEEDDKEAQDNHIKTSPHDYAKWYWPGLLAAAMGGTYGGWKLTDSFFDDRRQEEVEDELESAKEEFQEALTSHYPSPKSKMAAEKTAAQKLGEELDDLFLRIERATSLEKVANGDPISSAIGTATDLVQAPGKVVETVTSPQFKQKAMGAYGLYAIPTLLLGYLAAKHLSDKYSQRKILEKAVQRRAAKNYAKRPSELYAVPDPQVYVEPDEDEEE